MYPQFSYSDLTKKGLKFYFFLLLFIFNYTNSIAQCSLGLTANNVPINCLTSTTSGTVVATGGTGGPYTYTWLPTGGNFSVAVGLGPNTYSIIVKDALGCSGSTQLIINNSTGVSLNMATTNVTCFGQNNGQATVTVTGPANFPVTYSWTPAAPASSIITNLSAGTYSLLVTDAIGCTYTNNVAITQPSSVTATIATKTITCNGGLSSATVTASGGASPLTYSWAPVAGTGTVINNIPANTYSVTITDANSCVTVQTVTITQPAPLQNTLNLVHVACNTFTNGQASSNVSGGTPAYSYTWAPPNVNGSSVSGLSAGSYTLFVKDSKGCAITQSFTINQPLPITYTMTHTDEFCINADGTATVNVSGGNGPYTYSWNTTPVQTGSVAINLAAGNYSVLIKDANTCTNTAAVTIGNISNLVGQIISKTDVTCNGLCNGIATAGISGGTGPYSFTWLGIPNGTLATVNNLCQGTYSVKITDALGCYTQTTVTITEPPAMTYSVSGTGVVCYGQPASLTSTVAGGTPGYTYNWQPGGLTSSSITVTPTTTTAFSLTVTDSKGCTGAPKVYSVTVNAPITINAGANSLTVCPNVTTSVTVNANGGNGIYTYLWMPGSITTNSISVNLQSTTIYTVTIKDGCGTTPVSSTVSITVFQVQNPSFTVGNPTGCVPLCTQFNNTSSGTTTALWSFGDFSLPVQSPAVTHCYTKAGNYSVALTITNSFGCKFTLIKPNIITVLGKPLADFVQHPDFIDLNNNIGTFDNASVNATNLSWSLDGNFLSNSGEIEHAFLDVGCYNLQLIASNSSSCADTITKQICVTEGFNFWMPNAFSPDRDEHNNTFFPKGTGWVDTDYKFEIYNRWGVLIFKTTNTAGAWDGNYGGSKATDEVYVWHVFVKDIYDNDHDYRGHVYIMR